MLIVRWRFLLLTLIPLLVLAFVLSVVFNASGTVTFSLGTTSAIAVALYIIKGIFRFIRFILFLVTVGTLSGLIFLLMWWMKYNQ